MEKRPHRLRLVIGPSTQAARACRWQFPGVHASEERLARASGFVLFRRALSLRIRKGRSELMPFHSLLVTSPLPATATTSPVAATAKATAPMSLLRRPLFLLVLVASLGLAAATGRTAT